MASSPFHVCADVVFDATVCVKKNAKMKCPEDDLEFSLFAFPLISTNVQADLFGQKPILFYILA